MTKVRPYTGFGRDSSSVKRQRCGIALSILSLNQVQIEMLDFLPDPGPFRSLTVTLNAQQSSVPNIPMSRKAASADSSAAGLPVTCVCSC